MDGLAEWHFTNAGAVQVFQEAERAGSSGVTIGVSSLDAIITALDAAAIDHGDPVEATYVRLVQLSDPDNNRIVFTQ